MVSTLHVVLLCAGLLAHCSGAADEARRSFILTSRGEVEGGVAPAPAPVPATAAATALTAPFVEPVRDSTPTGWMQVGTPPKWLLAIFDTGSDKLVAKTWETVMTEIASVDAGLDGMVMPSELIYNHNTSSSYVPTMMADPASGRRMQEQTEIAYGSGTAITLEGSDTILIGGRQLKNFSFSEITSDSLQMLHTQKGIAAVLGLQHMKNRSLGSSLFSELRDKRLLSSFGYCKNGDDLGSFIWGDDSTEGQELEVLGEMHWAVSLKKVEVPHGASSFLHQHEKRRKAPRRHPGDEPLAKSDAEATSDDSSTMSGGDGFGGPGGGADGAEDASGDDQVAPLSPEELATFLCPEGRCTAILDTGSNIIAGPTKAMKGLTALLGVEPDCSNFDNLPNIHMELGGMPVTVKPDGYVMKIPMPTWANDAGGDGADANGDAEADSEDAEGGAGAGAGYRVRHGPAAAASSDDAGLAERRASAAVRRAAERTGWNAVFDHVRRRYGYDLAVALGSRTLAPNATNQEFLCKPALVPLDKHTQYGPLWIVGTPLMDSYYIRFGWNHSAGSSPTVHLKALEEATTCKDAKPDMPANPHEAPAEAALLRSSSASGSLVRAEAQRQAAASGRQSRQGSRGHGRSSPRERRLEEIAYPRWARKLLKV